MTEKLIKLFYKKFWINFIILNMALIILIIVTAIGFINYFKTNEKIYLPIVFSLCLIGLIIASIINLKPYIKDLKNIKKNLFTRIIGYGGDPPTTSYYPIVKDIITDNEVELRAENTKLNQQYFFIYLENTKLAVVENR